MSQGKLSPMFWIVVSRRERYQTKGSVRLDVEAPKKCPCPAACASLWRLPVSLAMTHLRWLHGQGGHESTDNTLSVVPNVGRLRAWPIDKCSDKDAGKHERKTPIPCVETNREKTEAKTKTTTELHTTTNVAITTHRTGQDRTGEDIFLSQ